MGLSVREYARRRGVSHTAVRKAVQTGRIPQEPDGTIDPAKADAAWDARTDPARKMPSASPPMAATQVRAPATPASPSPPQPPQPAPAASGATFAQARTMHEVAKAQKARLQVDRLKEEVVDRARASALVFKLARQERDAWITWPARVAAQMALQAGIDAHTMQTLLETYVRDHLGELAALEPNFR
ncbi:MAG: elements of external origin [Magnetospirillum sp.]|nr:MAG: elements of external origin [Magnetospirillum sp.]